MARQVWLVRPDGSEVRVIASDPAYAFGGYQWDPSGDRLTLQHSSTLETEARPEVLVWDLATEQMTLVAADAWLPGWLP